MDTDTAPVRPGRISAAALENLPEGFLETLRNPPPRLAAGPILYAEELPITAATVTAPLEIPEWEIRQRRMDKVRAGWAPIPEVGGYSWDVWRDADDPTIQVAAPARRTRFTPASNVPTGVPMRTTEAVGEIPPWGTLPAHEVNVGHRVLAGFGYARVVHTHFDSVRGLTAIKLELPTSVLLDVNLFREHVTPYLSITRDPFAGVAVHRLSAPVGSDRTIDQSPGYRY